MQVVSAQIAAINAQHRLCPICQSQRQRWISAEFEFVQSQLAATLPYARSAKILGLLLPVAAGNAVSTVREHLLANGRPVDIQSLQSTPSEVSRPEDVLNMTSVGLDSGYVRHCDPDGKQDFEVVAGCAIRADLGQRNIAFVRTIDDHANQRIKALLAPFSTSADNMEVFTNGDNQLRMAAIHFAGVKTHFGLVSPAPKSQQAQPGCPQQRTACHLKHADHDRLSELVDATPPCARSTRLMPDWPARPPAMPKAPCSRPLDKMLAVIGSRKRTRRTPPLPPCHCPAPPEPWRIS